MSFRKFSENEKAANDPDSKEKQGPVKPETKSDEETAKAKP